MRIGVFAYAEHRHIVFVQHVELRAFRRQGAEQELLQIVGSDDDFTLAVRGKRADGIIKVLEQHTRVLVALIAGVQGHFRFIVPCVGAVADDLLGLNPIGLHDAGVGIQCAV